MLLMNDNFHDDLRKNMNKLPSLFFGVFIGGLITFALPFSSLFAAEITLDKAVKIALSNNPQVDVALEQCLQGQGLFTQARSGYLPRLNAGADYGTYGYKGKDSQPGEDYDGGHGKISLYQLIYDFGRTTGAIDTSRFSLQAAEANLHQNMQDIVLSARTAFYTVLEKERLVSVAEEAVTNYEAHLYRAKRYFAAGVKTKIDVTNAKVNVSNAKLDLLRAKSDLQAARVDFENVLGIKPDNGNYILVQGGIPLKKLAQQKPILEGKLDSLLSAAFTYRSDMRQVHLLAQAAESGVTEAKSGYFPSFGINGQYDAYDDQFPNSTDHWNIGVGLTWDFFSGFETEGQVVEAKALYRELLASVNDLRLSVTQEVTESFLRAEENEQGVDLADEILGLAEENLELAEGRYIAGLNDQIEFNDAQLRLTEAQSNLVTTYYAYLTSRARIERAIGVTDGLTLKESDGMKCQQMQWRASDNHNNTNLKKE